MYSKGKGFLGAAALLAKKGGYEFVVLHLQCQGIELVIKSTLLAIDYDTFRPQLKKFGHDLVKATDAAITAFGLSPLRPNVRSELCALSQLYSHHILRYASGYDVLVDPKTIQRRLVLRRIVALIGLIERKGSMKQSVTI